MTPLSRRSFFALCSGAAAAAVAAPLVPTSAAPAYDWHEYGATWTTGAPLTAEHLNGTYEYTLKHDLTYQWSLQGDWEPIASPRG